METLSVIIALATTIIILVTVFIPGANLLREQSRRHAKFSMSKFQLWLWTLVICPCVALHWGYNHTETGFDYINATSLILLAISGTTTLTSSVIKQVQQSASISDPGYLKSNGLSALKTDADSVGFWSDILSDDNGQISIARLQNLVFTFIFLVIYVAIFFDRDKMQYIDFGTGGAHPYILMGISSGTYLVARGMFK
jgi:hypothetical protein